MAARKITLNINAIGYSVNLISGSIFVATASAMYCLQANMLAESSETNKEKSKLNRFRNVRPRVYKLQISFSIFTGIILYKLMLLKLRHKIPASVKTKSLYPIERLLSLTARLHTIALKFNNFCGRRSFKAVFRLECRGNSIAICGTHPIRCTELVNINGTKLLRTCCYHLQL